MQGVATRNGVKEVITPYEKLHKSAYPHWRMATTIQMDMLAVDLGIELEAWDAMAEETRQRYLVVSRVKSIQHAHEHHLREVEAARNKAKANK